MENIVDALKNLYTAFGGTASDVETITNISDIVNAISAIAGGTPALKMGIITGTTNSYGEISISKINAPEDFKYESFVCVRRTTVRLTAGGSGAGTAFVTRIIKDNGVDGVRFLIYDTPENGFTSSTLQKNKEVTIEFWYVPKS